jgi:urease accessory protein
VLHLTLDVGAGARVLVATQASTKVYRSLRPATQTLFGAVGAGGLLVVMPDPVVCFADADFSQQQQYDLKADASLVFVDWMTAGRHATGERWAFSRYASRTRIFRDTRAVFHDAVLLAPDLDSVGSRMNRFNVWLTAVLTGPLVRVAAEQYAPHREPISRTRIVLSASAARRRRAAANGRRASSRLAERSAIGSHSFVRFSGDDPWSRKW